MAFGVLDFIDANGVDLAEGAMLQTPSDDMFDGIKDLFPRSTEGLGRFFPRQATRPTG